MYFAQFRFDIGVFTQTKPNFVCCKFYGISIKRHNIALFLGLYEQYG